MEMEKVKKRVSFDDIFDERKAKIDQMSLNELRDYREYLKSWLTNTEDLRRVKGISRGRWMYLSGLRKVIINLLNHSKDRIKMINVVVHNGTTVDHAKRFFTFAADILPHSTFQMIYGLSLSEEEKEKMTIESVKEFIQESENIAKAEPNGNRK